MSDPLKLLIIDDNEEILAALCDFFTKKKYSVITATDGLEGLKFLDTDAAGFDLVITDIVMPNISGIGIISIIKKKYPDTPVIAITGWGEHPETLAAEMQADSVLEKPFDLEKLDRMVHDLVWKHR